MLSQGDSERVEALHGAMSCLPRCCSPSLLHEVLSSAKMCPELRRLDMEQTPMEQNMFQNHPKITQCSKCSPNVPDSPNSPKIPVPLLFRNFASALPKSSKAVWSVLVPIPSEDTTRNFFRPAPIRLFLFTFSWCTDIGFTEAIDSKHSGHFT